MRISDWSSDVCSSDLSHPSKVLASRGAAEVRLAITFWSFTMTDITMRQLLEAGGHFGHRTRHLNPKMDEYIFGSRSRIHIINPDQTLPKLMEPSSFAGRVERRRVGQEGGSTVSTGWASYHKKKKHKYTI